MATKISRKDMKHDEFVETAFDIGTWLEEHWKLLVMGIAGLAVVGLAVLGIVQWNASRLGEARRLLAEGMAAYDPSGTEDVQTALDRFERASEKAGGSPVGEVATYYRGLARLRSGAPDEAVPLLEQVLDSSNRVLADTARATLAEASDAAGDVERAKSLWRDLADSPDATFPTEMALLRLGRLLQREGSVDEARRTFEEIVEGYPQTSTATEARSLLASLGEDS